MKSALDLLAEIQMILAQCETGGITEVECVERIRAVMDPPETVALMLDLRRDDSDDEPPLSSPPA